jgi:hypothetical protein
MLDFLYGRSSIARIAPVSISALPRISPLEPFADRLARRLRPTGVATCDGPHTFHPRFVKTALLFIFPNRNGAFLQPVSGGEIQDG